MPEMGQRPNIFISCYKSQYHNVIMIRNENLIAKKVDVSRNECGLLFEFFLFLFFFAF